jgi:phosphoglucosamine mutase
MKQTLFGTDGVRNVVGSVPFTLSQLSRFAHAVAQWAHKKYGSSPRIVIAQDTRTSCDWIATTMQSALLAHGAQVFASHVLPTPVVGALLHHTTQFDCGVIISASHNPHTDNGIKLVDARSGKLSSHDEQEVEELFALGIQSNIDYAHLGTLHALSDGYQQYAAIVRPFFEPHFLHGITIVLDCAHGATHLIAPQLFTAFGARVIAINAEPNGTNINDACGALHPEQLQQAVIAHNAHVGFAFDGDGDRVIAVNKDGLLKNGDDILALLSTHPNYRHEPTIVGTIMSNEGFATFLKKQNKSLIRTPVGDKYVGAALKQENLLLGGEQSGHIIMRDYLPTGDGMFTALRVAQIMAATGLWDFETFIQFPQILINVPITHKCDLAQQPFDQLIKYHEGQLEQGRLIVRYSGTELLLRVMVEDINAQHAQTVGTALACALEKELN